MSKTIVIDTNILVRYFTGEDSAFANRLLDDARQGVHILFVSREVSFELAQVLTRYYAHTRQSVVDCFQALLAAPYILIEDRSFIENVMSLFEVSGDLVDCAVQARADLLKLPIATLDKKFQNKIGRGKST